MSRFLRENWAWIVVPALLGLAALAALLWFTGDGASSAFRYDF